MNHLKHLTTTAFLTSMMIMAGSSFSYAMDLNKDDAYEELLTQHAIQLSLKDVEEGRATAQPQQQPQPQATEEEKKPAAAAPAPAPQPVDLKNAGTQLISVVLQSEDQSIKELVNIFAAFSGKSPEQLKAKNDASLRHRAEEEQNLKDYGYRLTHTRLKKKFPNGLPAKKTN